ncbi:flavodoxin family protein [Caldicellulosiruptor changbaiensis]|uniref:Flavodoxin family protein n=1 Tax=Caldicellulosiruptor changbaiensis TaxID=1222016 RepID=A0A3T0D2B2_9FIRM|nr:flavodoxin family protein [Caldicellulosiruptor changbaiensis]AZT89204.1 flavodoxin family protein [Caldicellulosiruptor changbaiensis]
MRFLIVFYSLTGNSRKVAQALSKVLRCEIVEIKESSSRKSIFGFLRSGYEAITKKIVPIEDIDKDFSKYDHVIVVSPIWAGNLPSPVRSFLKRYLVFIKNISFIFTLASEKEVDVINVFEKDFGKKSLYCMSISKKKIQSQEFEKAVNEFAQKIKIE